jgi:hypothetical protein
MQHGFDKKTVASFAIDVTPYCCFLLSVPAPLALLCVSLLLYYCPGAGLSSNELLASLPSEVQQAVGAAAAQCSFKGKQVRQQQQQQQQCFGAAGGGSVTHILCSWLCQAAAASHAAGAEHKSSNPL